jgi:hypothetical protein
VHAFNARHLRVTGIKRKTAESDAGLGVGMKRIINISGSKLYKHHVHYLELIII